MPATVTSASNLLDRGSVSARQLVVLAVCFVLNMLDGFDITVMAFTAPPIGSELGLGADRLGIVFSAALAGMMLGAMFLAPLADVVGRRAVILAAVTTIGTMMCITGRADGVWALAIFRFVTGLGVGAMLAGLASLAAEYMPERYRGFGVATITAGYPFGAVVGGVVAAPLIADYGWRAVFVAGGGATFAVALLFLVLVPESLDYLCNRRPANALDRVNGILRQLGRAPVQALPPPAQGERTAARAGVGALLASPLRTRTLLLWCSFFFCFISLYFLMSWIPKLIVDAGLSLASGIYTSAAFNLGGVAGIFVLGWLSTRIALSALIGTFLCAGAVLMLGFGALPRQALPLMVATVLVGLLMQGGFVGLYAAAAKLYGTQVRATGVGWAIGLGRFGAVVGPWLGGLLIAAQTSLATSFALFAAPLLVAGLFAFALRLR